jgi:GTP-binding protein
MKFLDQVKIYIKAGNGGDGSPSFRREKFIEYGGPDGGDGGKGGSIILKSEQNLNTLIDYRYQQHHKAMRGENGMGQNRTGKSGEDLFLKVPLGTQVFEEDNKTLIYDFVKLNDEFVAAAGGKGGLGNTRFKSSTNRAPKKFTKGALGEEFTIWLQLKTIADIGIIGLPNSGKSSLLASITNANPKIANYQFTTLNPNLGVASYDDKEITIADIPGLIEGAHAGTGLGVQFLKHIERCKTLLHLIDITNADLEKSYNQVKNELKSYSPDLLKKKELIVFNKIDLIDADSAKEITKKFSKKLNKEIFMLSTLKKSSVSQIKAKLITYVS